ncbi:class I SAM-dependent methyltransferase [Candidatus Thorarchaeota archaeon]|nr:MAG: class I SAM-dependent methyltransferase [Candidatus Thorarchaeota archaeon]
MMPHLGKADWSDPERVQSLTESYENRYGAPFWSVFLDLIDSASVSEVLEFGSGPGLFLVDAVERLGARRVYGIDESAEMIEQAKEFLSRVLDPGQFTLVQLNLDTRSVPFESEIAELAFSGFVLHEVADPADHVESTRSLLKNNGIYAIYDFVSGNEAAFIEGMKARGMNEERAKKKYPHMCKHSVEDIRIFFRDAGYGSSRYKMVNDFVAIVVGLKSSS